MIQKEKLKELAASATRKAEVQSLLTAARAEWQTAQGEAARRKARLTRETADVEKLDRKDLSNLILTVTGRMDDKRAAETAEANEAQALYDAANTRSEELCGQVVSLELELRKLGNCDKDLEILAAAMTAEIQARGGGLATEITEIKARMEKNTAEVKELETLMAVGKRLSEGIQNVLPVLRKARISYDRRNGSARHGGGLLISEMSLNEDLDRGEGYIPMLVTLAGCFKSDLIDLPPVGRLQTLQNTFNGTYRGSTADQLDAAISEMEALDVTVGKSLDKINRVLTKRVEARDNARNEWLEILMK